MNTGNFYYPLPINEPVYSFAPGTAERELVKKALKQLKSKETDVPMSIGAEQITTDNKIPIHPPHERDFLLGHFNFGDATHVKKAIDAALEAKEKWANTSWENRANIFLKAADFLPPNTGLKCLAATMLGQSKNVYPGRN